MSFPVGKYYGLCFLMLLFSSIAVFAGGPGYLKNQGQWHKDVLYRTEFHGGSAFVDRQGLTVVLHENGFFSKLHSWWQDGSADNIGFSHALKIQLVGATLSGNDLGEKILSKNTNFFLGNDSSRWASNVPSYERILFKGAYQGIDIRYGRTESNIKYDFIVAPQADPSQIVLQFEGEKSMQLKEGNLLLETSVGTLTEMAPFAYQQDEEGRITPVLCQFVCSDQRVTYSFPEDYDHTRELIIDPELAFSTYVGSTSDNFGFTASYDPQGNLYGGGIVYGGGYPTTSGAFQENFTQGVVDVGITKFNSDGSTLLYSTYIGGSGNEAPHSVVVGPDTCLYVFGSTSSQNFPVGAEAFQSTFQGGTSAGLVSFTNVGGSDMYVIKLSPDGSDMVSSTYVGGSGNDGARSGTVLTYNYGDQFRGEIVVDNLGNAYVASVTDSQDFPIVNGYAGSFSGLMSGLVFKLSSDLSTLLWSTYSGGSSLDAAYGLQLAADNSVYFTGGTSSNDLPVTAGAYQSSWSGEIDGYLGHISADGSQLLAMTYNGTGAYDQNYFVQIDTQGDIYIVGQTDGSYPVSSGVYTNPNSGQFIQKFSPDLSTSLFSTVIGTGAFSPDFSPSAFLVSDCGQIFISGWGGELNPGSGSVAGLPTTSDAFQSGTDGNDFYLMVLAEDATDLVYGTYFGGPQSREHVDGGTSRFDKNGTVYQAVCAGCGGNDDFPTQPGVWSQTNNSLNCNLGVFKMKLSSVNAVANIDAPDLVCPGIQFDLINQSEGADIFTWTLGDGTTSEDTELSYSFDNPGTYTIQLYAEDSEGCLAPDSVSIQVVVAMVPNVEVDDPPSLCPGDNAQLQASGASIWQWTPAIGLNASTISNPIFNGSSSTDYMVIGSTLCGVDTAFVSIVVGSNMSTISNDAEICPGDSIHLLAGGGLAYLWSPSDGLNSTNIPNPTASPAQTTTYGVQIENDEGCTSSQSVEIVVLPAAPVLTGKQRYVSCNGSPVQLNVDGAGVYAWTPEVALSAPDISNPMANPVESTTYSVMATNICGSDVLDIQVLVSEVNVSVMADTLVCHDTPFKLQGFGAKTYIWQPASAFSFSHQAETTAIIKANTWIKLTGIDSLGCSDTESNYIQLYPRETVRAGNDFTINYGDEVQLESFSIYPITWDASPYLSCLQCNYPYSDPPESTVFFASIESPDGCNETDSVTVHVRGNLYVPNAFTPNGDGLNDIFKAKGTDISSFNMKIYNRLGDLVYEGLSIDRGWNGSNKGSDFYCPADVYQYRIVAAEHRGKVFELMGHVTLLR